MTKKTKLNLCLVLLITALGFSAAAFAGAGIIHRPLTRSQGSTPLRIQQRLTMATVKPICAVVSCRRD